MGKCFPGPDVGHIEDSQHGAALRLFKRAGGVEGTSDQKLEMNTEILEPTEVVTSNHLCLSRTKGLT